MDNSEGPSISNEVVMVAIVNQPTLEDKLKEHALMMLITSVGPVVVMQVGTFVAGKITAYRTKKALAKKNEIKKD